MSTNHLKAALKDERAQLEQQLMEIIEKLSIVQKETENVLSQKVRLEMRLQEIDEDLNQKTPLPSTKSVTFIPNTQNKETSYHWMNQQPSIQVMSCHVSAAKVFSPSCKSLDNCSECQKAYIADSKPSEVSNKSVSSNCQQSCMSMANCSICQRAYMKVTQETNLETESVCYNCKTSMEALSAKESQNHQSCTSLGLCSMCQRAFMGPTVKGSEVTNAEPSVVNDCIKSTTSSKACQALPSCTSLGQCSNCLKDYQKHLKICKGEAKSQETVVATEHLGTLVSKNPKVASILDHAIIQSFDVDEESKSMKIDDVMSLYKGSINPVADVVYNIYYSTSNTQTPSKVPSATKSQNSIKSKKSNEKLNAKKSNLKLNSKKSKEKLNVKISTKTVAADQPDPQNLKPFKIAKKKKKFNENFCPQKGTEEVPDKSASEIMEENRIERLKKEEEKKKKQNKEKAEAYANFLKAQEEEEIKKQKLLEGPQEDDTCENDDGKKECFYTDECSKDEPEPELGTRKKVVKVEYCKIYLKIKYAIEMQNYKISKMCQELKSAKKSASLPQKAKLRAEIEKLNKMIEHAMNRQKEHAEEIWGTIPVSTASLTQIKANSFDFEKVSFPKAPSNVSLGENLFEEVEKNLIEKEKLNLENMVELQKNHERFLELTEQSKKMENELYVLQQENTGLKQKEKYFDSVKEDFDPDKKIVEVQDAMDGLMRNLNKMKNEFDDVHLKIHHMKG